MFEHFAGLLEDFYVRGQESVLVEALQSFLSIFGSFNPALSFVFMDPPPPPPLSERGDMNMFLWIYPCVHVGLSVCGTKLDCERKCSSVAASFFLRWEPSLNLEFIEFAMLPD